MGDLQQAHSFRLGVVEGFFGRQWSWQARRDHASFLAQQKFTTYLYAPKNDVYLRKQWFTPYPTDVFNELGSLAQHAKSLGLEFGVGLSPFELYRDFSLPQRELLLRKLEQLNQLQAPLLGVLFDDMLGELPGLAAKQLAILECIRTHSNAQHLVLCPTYYSADPLLTRHFGAQPEHYLETLGEALPAEVAVFWTGPKVVSHCYPRDHLLEVGAKLRRKPLLWDNYPVNDNKRLTNFLHLQPYAERQATVDGHMQHFDLQPVLAHCSGLLANPMNQAYLSQLPLTSLASWCRKQTGQTLDLTPAALHSPLLARLSEDSQRFQHAGLAQIAANEKSQLLAVYQAWLPDPMALEVCEWLQGLYAFDPACLT